MFSDSSWMAFSLNDRETSAVRMHASGENRPLFALEVRNWETGATEVAQMRDFIGSLP